MKSESRRTCYLIMSMIIFLSIIHSISTVYASDYDNGGGDIPPILIIVLSQIPVAIIVFVVIMQAVKRGKFSWT